MKTQTLRILLAFVTAFTIVFSSCKKDSDTESQKNNCRIISFTDSTASGVGTCKIFYNNEGKVSVFKMPLFFGSVSVDTMTRAFQYSGNTIMINTTDQGGSGFIGLDSLTLDNDGRLSNVRQFENPLRTHWQNTRFEYNGDALTKIYNTSSLSVTPSIATITSQNGNVVYAESMAGGSVNVTYEYFTDKNVQTGDYLVFDAFTRYGVPYFPQKNLVRKIDSGGGNVFRFDYEMNTDGLISKITFRDGNGSITGTRRYQYQCY